MPTNSGWFILLFNKMAIIFLGVYLSFLPFQVLSFNESDCLDFIANDEWPHPISIHWIIRFGGNAGVLTTAVTEAKSSSRVLKCMLVNLVCVAGENHWQHCERLPQATANVCVSQRWTIWAFNVIIHLTDTNCYTWLNIVWCDLFCNEKFKNFVMNEIELLKFEGSY